MIKCVEYTGAGMEFKQEGTDDIDIDEQFLDENGLYERNTFIAKCEKIDWNEPKIPTFNIAKQEEKQSNNHSGKKEEIQFGCNFIETDDSLIEPRNFVTVEYNPIEITKEQKPTADLKDNKRRNKRTLIPWTTQQKELAENFFSRHIREKIPPKKMEVIELQEKYPEIFFNKTWPVIKVHICNKFRCADEKSSLKVERHDDIKSNLNFDEENRPNEPRNDVIAERNLLEITKEQKPTADLKDNKRRNKRTLIPWTTQQKELAENFFNRHIQEKIPPKKMEVVELQEKYPEIFFNKKWPAIKVYICNKFKDADEKSSHKVEGHDDIKSNLNFDEENRLNEPRNDVIEEPNLLEITTEQKPTTTDLKNNKRRNKRTLIPWTTQQKELAENFFSRHIREKIPPKKMEVIELKEKYPEVFFNKTWPVIKVYICNKFRDPDEKSSSKVEKHDDIKSNLNFHEKENRLNEPRNDVIKERNLLEITTEQKPTTTDLKDNKQRNKRILIPWTTQQKELAENFFNRHIREKIPPKKMEVVELQEKYPEIFFNKKWPAIKVYICNKFKDADEKSPLKVERHDDIKSNLNFDEENRPNEPRNDVIAERNLLGITIEQKPTTTDLKVNKQRNKRILIPWTTQQKELAENFFNRHIREKIPPKKMEVVELQEKYPEIFFNKKWPAIKVYICNKFKDADEKSPLKVERHDDIKSNLNFDEENRPNEPRNDVIAERNLLGITIEQKPTTTDLKVNKQRNKRILIPWTTQQKELAENFFNRHIREKIPPKKMEVVELQEKYPEIFFNKKWPAIKVYICNKFKDADEKSPLKVERHDDIKSNLNFDEENRLNEPRNDVIEEPNLLEITTEQKPTTTDLKNNKRRNKRTLIPWTTQQKELAENFFSRHIREKIPPKKMEVIELQEKYPEVFFNKTWPVIKGHICNKFRDADEKSSLKVERHDDIKSNLNFDEENRPNEPRNDVIEERNLLEITKEQKPTTTNLKYNKRRNKRTLIPWTAQQKELAENFFSRHIREKIPPKKMEVVELQEKYPEVFFNKTWPVIKVYICNKFRNEDDVTVECNPIEISKEQKPTSDSNLLKDNKRNNKRTLVPWTTQQKNLAVNFFRKHIKEKVPPQKKEVMELQEKYPEIFSNKTWPVIKVYICNKFKDAEEDWM